MLGQQVRPVKQDSRVNVPGYCEYLFLVGDGLYGIRQKEDPSLRCEGFIQRPDPAGACEFRHPNHVHRQDVQSFPSTFQINRIDLVLLIGRRRQRLIANTDCGVSRFKTLE